MTEFTLADLSTIVNGAVGDLEGEQSTLDASLADTPFVDLGLDSLGLMEVGATISRDVGVPMEDDAISAGTTPAEVVAQVNALLQTVEPAVR